MLRPHIRPFGPHVLELLILGLLILGLVLLTAVTFSSSQSQAVSTPTISSLSPVDGPKSGGTEVTLTGTNFVTPATVTVDGMAAAGVVVDSSTSVRFTTPAGTIGAQDVILTTGGLTLTRSAGFTYLAELPGGPTSVSGVSRDASITLSWAAPSNNGGSSITGYHIEQSRDGGINFTTVIGNTASTATTALISPLVNSTSYAFRVAAINAIGAGAFSPLSAETIPQAPPTVSGITPGQGTDLGGTSVTITGSAFTGATSVSVGGTVVASFTVNSATQITAVTAAGVAGIGNVVVTTTSGTGTGSALFQYLAIPTLSSVNPFYGPLAGGTTVVLTGTKLTGAIQVSFDGTNASSFTVNSATQITAVTPAGLVGATDVVVTTAAGSATLINGFTYYAIPSIVSLSQESGPTTGGTSIVITGANFTGTTAVTLNGVNATSYTVNSATQITTVTPPSVGAAAGAVAVRVTGPGGTAVRSNGFNYVAAGDAIEIVLRDKSESQVQFHICHNLPNPTSLNLGMQIEFRIRQGSSVVAPTNSSWLQSVSPNVAYQPGTTYNPTHVPPADFGVSSTDLVMRYRPNQNPNVTAISIPACGQNMAGMFPWFSNQTGSTGGTWEDGSGNALANGPALTPGTTYVLEATLLTTTRAATPVYSTYRTELVTTMGGGCPIGAPVESLPAYPQMWAGLDSNNQVVQVADVYELNPWGAYPSVVSTAYTYPTWPGKTFAQRGSYFDPRTNNFGPQAVLGDVISGATVLTQANMSACQAAGHSISLAVDPSSSGICTVSGGVVQSLETGACIINVTATRIPASSLTGITSRSVSTLTRTATFVVRQGSSGGGASSGGASGSHSSSSGGTVTAGDRDITAMRPALGPLSGGNTASIIGYGFTGATAVFIGGNRAAFTFVSDSRIDVVIPLGGAPGSVDVQVVISPTLGHVLAPGGYVYVPGTFAPTSEASNTLTGTAASGNPQSTIPSLSTVQNPLKSISLANRVSVLSQKSAQEVQTREIRKSVATAAKTSPRLSVTAGIPFQLQLKGMMGSTGTRVDIRIGQKYWPIGSATTTNIGQLILPALEAQQRGTYIVRITQGASLYYVKLSVR